MTDSSYAYFKGEIVPLEQANVSIMNQTFMYGLGVFEGIRGYWNATHEDVYLFRLREHIERMFDSMKIMYLPQKWTVDQVCDIIVELARRNAPRTDIYVRPAVYSGTNSITPCLAKSTSELCILTLPLGDYIDTTGGLRVVVSAWRRVEDNAIPARAKIIGSYVNTCLAKTDAALAGMDDCIVLSESGHIAEGSAMNLFMVKRGQLITTPTTENILEGITRSTIMELAEREFGLTTIARAIDRSELYTADELFFCGTGAQVAPIAEVDNRKVGDGNRSISNKIRDAYIQLCRGNLPGYEKWLTPIYNAKRDAAAVLPISAPAQMTA
jgi:branched-chain amino acid aminotransferase